MPNPTRRLRGLAATLALAASAASARAATPALDQVVPRGAQRGTEVEMTLTGNRLADAQEVLLYQPGIEVVDLKPVGANAVKCRFRVSADARYG
ncbi:MAG: hypothetical protein JWO31_1174, partial [Phycisphaerales bacterium]|nr:hypothetical protein [Phycisphaerales bacterium]